MNIWDKKSFIKEIDKTFGKGLYEVIGDYENQKSPITILCNMCGKMIQSTPDNFFHVGCKYCNTEKRRQQNEEEFIRRSKEKFGENAFDYSRINYKNLSIPIELKCNSCGEINYIQPRGHLHSECGCKYCAGIAMNNNVFIKKSKKIYGDKKYSYDKLKYVKQNDYVDIYCNDCKKYFRVNAYNHLHHHSGCPDCREKKFILEEKTCKALTQKGVDYIRQKTFQWLKTKKKSTQSLDFYLPSHNIAIECQGIQHYKPTRFGGISLEAAQQNLINSQERDRRKRMLCSEHNIKLFYIKYNEDVDKKIEDILKSATKLE